MSVGLKKVSVAFWVVIRCIRCARTCAAKRIHDKPRVKVMQDALGTCRMIRLDA